MSSGRSSSSRVNQRRAVAVEEPDEPDLALLRMAVTGTSAPARAGTAGAASRPSAWPPGSPCCAACAARAASCRASCDRAFERRIDLRHDRRQSRPSARRRREARWSGPARRWAAADSGAGWFSAFSSCGCSASSGRPYLRQEAQRGRIDERGRGALVHQRHRHVEVGVDLAQLAQIGQLVRARDVTDGGEERVLDDAAAAARSG